MHCPHCPICLLISCKRASSFQTQQGEQTLYLAAFFSHFLLGNRPSLRVSFLERSNDAPLQRNPRPSNEEKNTHSFGIFILLIINDPDTANSSTSG